MEFRNVIFSSGGSRCFWQLGFWDGANHAGMQLNQTVDYTASTSAGCAMATICIVNRAKEALEIFKDMTARNPRNIHWQNLKPGSGKPLLPHIEMYKAALEKLLMPLDMQHLSSKRLEFLIEKLPRSLPSTLGTLAAFTIYSVEKYLTGTLHPTWTRRLGFEPLVRGNQDAESVTEFIDIILASSCVPPFLPGDGYMGQRVLDGSIIDNVPAHLAEGRVGRTLVLLSKRCKRPLPEPAQKGIRPAKQAYTHRKFRLRRPLRSSDGL